MTTMSTVAKSTSKSDSVLPRLITAVILIGAMIALIHFGHPQLIFAITYLMFGLAHRELLLLHPQIRTQKYNSITAYYGLAIWLLFPNSTVVFGLIFALTLLTPLFAWWQGDNKAEMIVIQAYRVFALFYIALPLWSVLQILQFSNFEFLLFLAVATTACGDSFAYFGGRLFGKRKLAPRISPNKTQEGAFCALVGGALASWLMHFIFGQSTPLWQQITIGMILAVLGILGDLSESALKRAFGVKDSGNLLPGHGGVLDRIDAYLFTLPFAYLYGLWMAR